MKQIRYGVFETNSSSTHSLTMCMKSDFDAWKSGDLYLNEGCWRGDNINEELAKKTFITKDEIIELVTNDKYSSEDDIAKHFDEYDLGSYEIYTYLGYRISDYLMYFQDSFIAPNGEEIIAFGEFGMDG